MSNIDQIILQAYRDQQQQNRLLRKESTVESRTDKFQEVLESKHASRMQTSPSFQYGMKKQAFLLGSQSNDISGEPDQEQELVTPNWDEYFSHVTKDVMEAAADKAAARGLAVPPSDDAWRLEAKREGEELAKAWGNKRDKATREVQGTHSAFGAPCTGSSNLHFK